MSDDEKLFMGFIEGLVDYAPRDYDEGFGTVYERYVMEKYLRDLKRRLNIESVFEGPSDGITGIRGINSYPFADEGCEVTYYTPSKREEEYTKTAWNLISPDSRVTIKTGKPLSFPFEDDSFDLSWNFCILEHLKNPVALASEMVRVSKRYVLFMTQNVFNIGTFPHVIYHLLYRKPWDHGMLRWMSFGGIKKIVSKLELNIIEEGVIDVPPWPDTWDMPVRGFFKKGMESIGESWNWSTLTSLAKDSKPNPLIRRVELFEKLPLPTALKLPFAHHLYVLCEK